MGITTKSVKIVQYLGTEHNKSHDPKRNEVKRVLREIKICKCEGREMFNRGGKKIRYIVFKSEKPCSWTIIGLTNKTKGRKKLPRYNGFKMVITCSGYVKTLFFFKGKTLGSVKMSALNHGDSQVMAQDFPLIDISKVKLRRSTH